MRPCILSYTTISPSAVIVVVDVRWDIQLTLRSSIPGSDPRSGPQDLDQVWIWTSDPGSDL